MTDRPVAYEFGEFRLDPVVRVFTRQDQPIALPPKSFDLLMLFLDGGRTVLCRLTTADIKCRRCDSGRMTRALVLLLVALLASPGLHSQPESQGAVRSTRVSIVDGQWHINGKVTYPGAKAEGLLMNVRMVNAVFEDANDTTRPKGFDPDANTDAFIRQIPDYVASGVRAFTLCLQGGMPGYEGAVNSAFNPDGSLRDAYLKRVRRVIEACDRHGAVVILGCYYQRQDQILKDEAAVRAGVVNVARWVQDSGFTNVVLEIANEFAHRGFDHAILKRSPGRSRADRAGEEDRPGLLVSTSGHGKRHAARRGRPGQRLPADPLQHHRAGRYPGPHRRAEEVRQADRVQRGRQGGRRWREGRGTQRGRRRVVGIHAQPGEPVFSAAVQRHEG